MRPPEFTATVRQRLLLNYRADPDVVATVLPDGLRPRLVGEAAVVGICVLRLRAIRPSRLPAAVGIDTDNAAHRVGVEWDTPDGVATGVYVPFRVTSSRLTTLLGGRMFPGVHTRVAFAARAERGQHHIDVRSRRGDVSIRADATETDTLGSSMFGSLGEASGHFESASVGWSPGRHGRLEGLAMAVTPWAVRPVRIDALESSWFDDRDRFPPGSLQIDSGLLMTDVTAHWDAISSGPSSQAGAGASTSSLTSSAAGAARYIS